jgi:hypothetical protein
MTNQALSLKNLKELVNVLIEQQGEDAPVAWWVFSANDVLTMNDDGDEVYYSKEINEKVLTEVQRGDYIYEQIGECIEDEINRIKVTHH